MLNVFLQLSLGQLISEDSLQSLFLPLSHDGLMPARGRDVLHESQLLALRRKWPQ